MTLQQTKIEWTDFTVNFWEGCQKVGPGCDNCYALARDIRFTGGTHWGPGAPRRKIKGGVAKLRKIQRKAVAFRETHGHWPRVFCSSLSDVFDNAVAPAWRAEAFAEMEAATDCRIQLLTKRIGNVEKMIPDLWKTGGWPAHIGLMITVVTQEEANRDIMKLLALKARLDIPWVGLSVEPMLGPVDLTRVDTSVWWLEGGDSILSNALKGWRDTQSARGVSREKTPTLDWVIVGGESGRNARPMHPDWPRDLRDQCVAAGVAFFFKQWGEWTPRAGTTWSEWVLPDGSRHSGSFDTRQHLMSVLGEDSVGVEAVGKKRAGNLLDGKLWQQFPEAAA